MYLSRWILKQIEEALSKAFQANEQPREIAPNIIQNYGASFLRDFLPEWTPDKLIAEWKDNPYIEDSPLYTPEGHRFLSELHGALTELVAAAPSEPEAGVA